MTRKDQQFDRQNEPPQAEQTGDPQPSSSADSLETALPEMESMDSRDRDAAVLEEAQEQLKIAEQENVELKDRLLRVTAEFDNYKKRIDRQWSEFKKYAHENLIKELLSAVDNLERAVEAAGKDKPQNDGLITGVNITLTEILKTLERFGVTPITSKGEKFNPAYHQAVSTKEAVDTEENIILEEFQKGYMMHDRLLRPAMVVVSVKK